MYLLGIQQLRAAIAELVGVAGANALAKRFGGERLYIPVEVSRAAWLLEVVDPQSAYLLWQEYQGRYLLIPFGRRGGPQIRQRQTIAERNHLILSLIGTYSKQELARRFSLHRRQIQRISSKYESHAAGPL